MTKENFLSAYRAKLIEAYPWAQDAAKLDRYMESVRATIHDTAGSWNPTGNAVVAAWKAIGGKGTPSLKAMRGLA